MTVSIRISRTDPPTETERGGLIAAFAGSKGYAPGGSTDVEIAADNEFDSAVEAAGWVEEIAIVASSTFRHAVHGEVDGGVDISPEEEKDAVPDDGLPLRITKPAELEALPPYSVILGSSGDAWQKRPAGEWECAIGITVSETPDSWLPATLIYRGEN